MPRFMNKYIAIILAIFFFGCKSKATLLEGAATSNLSADKVIANHYNNKKDFSTLYIKASAKYRDDKQSQSVTAEIKIKKDQQILVSVRFLGITMAKALITPTEVKYYDKINNEYFEGDYSGLSKWLGTDLDFNKVQNLLLGGPIDDLHKSKYAVSIMNKWYKLENDTKSNTNKAFYFEAERFLLKQQEINQPNAERELRIVYPEYKEYSQMILPLSLVIDANSKGKNTNISVEYKSVSFNEDLSFPYAVPEGFERIYIEKQ
jgi:hypothetical protein